MDEVLKLVNRLQSACTLLGDTAGQKDSDLPGLWEMLPSIVVIGGQVIAPPSAAASQGQSLVSFASISTNKLLIAQCNLQLET
jgi:hypothetical protein